jgi:hypothetical protein
LAQLVSLGTVTVDELNRCTARPWYHLWYGKYKSQIFKRIAIDFLMDAHFSCHDVEFYRFFLVAF